MSYGLVYFQQRANMLKGNLSDESLTRAIALIIAAISDRGVINQCPSEELRDCLALHFIDCFVKFLNLKGEDLNILPKTLLI
jgi:ubiquitin carboxyl-terminal hydrolase 34